MAIVVKRTLDSILSCNPVIGCTFGCPYCYARKLNQRFKFTPDFKIPTEFPQALKKFHTRLLSTIFFNTMSDLADWDSDWRDKVFTEMTKYPRNTYIFLTKRPEMCKFDCTMANIWAGVTVTGINDVKRIRSIKENCKARHYWITFEPLFGDCGKLDLRGIDWIVIGAETGNRSGKVVPKKEWILSISKEAEKLGIPVCMKESLRAIVGDENMKQEFPDKDFA